MKLLYKVNDLDYYYVMSVRICVFCEEKFEGTTQFCSKKCQGNQHTANNKNPVGHIRSTEGVHEAGCCYDEQSLAPSAQWLLDKDDGYSPRVTEDERYLASIMSDLPPAKYTNGQEQSSVKYQIDAQREKKGLAKRGFGDRTKFHRNTAFLRIHEEEKDTSETYGERADKLHKRRKIK
mgnify:CR=1 FL=1|tara:strand:+ start:215 stop:748 length:534 start_codon:yes stop_codon:yes gene_type:complete